MRDTRARKSVLILELIASALFLGIGAWLWASASSGSDPHGMVAGFGNLALLLGIVLLTSALFLRWSSPWAWAVQLLPLGTAAYLFALLALG